MLFHQEENAMKYFINAQVWSAKANIEMFYFSSFDESWKVGDEGDVGAYWGLWDKHRKTKVLILRAELLKTDYGSIKTIF